MKYIALILFLLLPFNVYSYNETLHPACTLKEKAKLRADVLNFNYELEKYKDKEDIYYKVTIHNFSPNIIVEYDKNLYTHNNNVISKVVPGSILQLKIFADTSGICNGFNISKKSLSVPYFNIHKDDDLCLGNEEFFLCKENVNTNISKEEFEKKIAVYVKSKEKKEIEEETIKKEIPKNNVFLTFLLDYYVYILFTIITVCVVAIILLLERKKKNIL